MSFTCTRSARYIREVCCFFQSISDAFNSSSFFFFTITLLTTIIQQSAFLSSVVYQLKWRQYWLLRAAIAAMRKYSALTLENQIKTSAFQNQYRYGVLGSLSRINVDWQKLDKFLGFKWSCSKQNPVSN